MENYKKTSLESTSTYVHGCECLKRLICDAKHSFSTASFLSRFSQELQRCLSCSAECVSSKHRTPSRSEAARKITAKQKPLSSSGHDVIEQDYDVTDGPIEELTNLFASEM